MDDAQQEFEKGQSVMTVNNSTLAKTLRLHTQEQSGVEELCLITSRHCSAHQMQPTTHRTIIVQHIDAVCRVTASSAL